MKRRTLIRGMAAAACAATLGVLPSLAAAQGAYPNRTVVVLSPGAAGGFTDTVSRLIALGLTERWKLPVIVENRPGAGGTIGGAWAARQPADGYMLFLSNTASDVLSPAIYKKIDYNSLTDFDPVILAVKTPVVLAANMDFPATSVKELIALAKARPGTINFGYPGNGSTGHLAGALFSSLAGVELSPVPYKGTPEIMVSIMNGSIQLTFDNAGLWAPQIKSGRVRPLAVSSLKRSSLLPDVPTLNEAGLTGYEAVTFAGISVPKGTPKEIIDKVNRDIQAVIDGPDFRAKMAGGEVVTSSPESYRQFLMAEQAKWGAVVKQVGLRID